jgi:uncharacterized protein (TIGR02266 family)
LLATTSIDSIALGMGREHRQSERHRVRFKLVYDDGNSFNAGSVSNVSETGLFLETALPLPVGTIVRLMPLNDAGDRIFEVDARVMRTVPYDETSLEPAGMGLQFVELTPEQRRIVVDMIHDLQDRAAHFQGERDPYLGVLLPSQPPMPAADPSKKPGDP